MIILNNNYSYINLIFVFLAGSDNGLLWRLQETRVDQHHGRRHRVQSGQRPRDGAQDENLRPEIFFNHEPALDKLAEEIRKLPARAHKPPAVLSLVPQRPLHHAAHRHQHDGPDPQADRRLS